MTTVADSIAECRRSFFTSYRPQINVLTNTMNASETTVTVDDPVMSIQAGADISIGLEVMRVRSISGQVARVIRGWGGSTAAAHTSGAIVYVNSQITDFDIFSAIRNDLVDLSAPDNGLFAVTSYEFNYAPTVQGYPISVADIIDVIDVRYQTPGPWKNWPMISSYRFDQNTPTSDFPSGNSLTIYDSGYPGMKVHVRLMVPFTPPTALTDDLQSHVGLPATCNDLPALGAAIRLGAGREVQRNFNESQGQPRRSDEVPAGANLGSFRNLQALRQQRVLSEANRLKTTYPTYRH